MSAWIEAAQRYGERAAQYAREGKPELARLNAAQAAHFARAYLAAKLPTKHLRQPPK